MDVALLVVVAVAGAALQRSAGAGYSLLLLPAAVVTVGTDRAVAVVLAAGVVLGCVLLCSGGVPKTLGRVVPVLATAPVGQVLATTTLGALDGRALRLVTAALLAVGVLVSWRPLPTPPKGVAMVAGVLIGAIAALSGVIGPFLAVVVIALRDSDVEETRRRLWFGVTLLCATGLLIGLLAGTDQAAGAAYGVALTPALMLGVALGARFGVRIPARVQTVAVLAVAMCGAVILAAGAA